MNLADIILIIVVIVTAILAAGLAAYVVREVDHKFGLIPANQINLALFVVGTIAIFGGVAYLLYSLPQPRAVVYQTFPTATVTPTPTLTPTPTITPTPTKTATPTRTPSSASARSGPVSSASEPLLSRDSAKTVQTILKPVWELLLFVPVPFRYALVAGVVIWILFRMVPSCSCGLLER